MYVVNINNFLGFSQNFLTDNFGQDDWKTANQFCETLNVYGYSDWRLPTKEELNIIYKNKVKINGLESAQYWSSTVSSTNYFWTQSFGDGNKTTYPNGNSLFYRCVRK
ncbi:MAG TPA: DUF1566 domain-containing protein [Bacteroidales bacterium]|nr:DUF1566 domain-containing protein [Bacteroidales bacterium]